MFSRFSILIIFSILLAACSHETRVATPLETFQTYAKAAKQKDITTMKLLLSKESLKMFEDEAKAQGVTLDDIVKRETLIDENQRSVKFKDEKVEGEHATIQIQSDAGEWEPLPFVKEDGEWRIDQRSYASNKGDQLEQQNDAELDRIINQGKQP